MSHTRVIVTHYGGPDALWVVEEECPEPKKGVVLGLGGPRAEPLLDVTLTGANTSEEDARSAVRVGNVGHGHRLLVDIPAEAAWARLGQRCPPKVSRRVRHPAALVSGQRTRVPSGGNLPSLEVIMSSRTRRRVIEWISRPSGSGCRA
jgi:hypothetical protein